VKIYLIGSLRNAAIPDIANTLRSALPGVDVFASWFAAGPRADDHWQEYEQGRGLSYIEALADAAAQNVYHFDKKHLDSCDVAVLVYPAGKSAHLELGYCAGKGKTTYILLDQQPERWDVMTNFADAVHISIDTLIADILTPPGHTL
jgi:hypothetical protein